MDRPIVQPGMVPLESTPLQIAKTTMVSFAKMCGATFGVNGIINNFPCVPGTGLTVAVGPGEVYQSDNIDSTQYGSIPADTAHQIIKQGILLDPVVLSVPAPGTAGQSINYLVQVKFQDIDGQVVTLPYFNPSNPTVPYAGPGGTGTSQATMRAGTMVVSLKAGTAAATGSQTTPSVDAGYIGAYVITIANGAGSVVTGNIAAFSASNFVGADILTQVRTQYRATRGFFAQG